MDEAAVNEVGSWRLEGSMLGPSRGSAEILRWNGEVDRNGRIIKI